MSTQRREDRRLASCTGSRRSLGADRGRLQTSADAAIDGTTERGVRPQLCFGLCNHSPFGFFSQVRRPRGRQPRGGRCSRVLQVFRQSPSLPSLRVSIQPCRGYRQLYAAGRKGTMAKEICISSTPHETRLAILEDDQLAEIYYERENEYTLAGSIYNGRVTSVLPGMQSAFVDLGLERDAFLYVTDFIELEDQEETDELEKAAASRASASRDPASPWNRPQRRPPGRTQARVRPKEQNQDRMRARNARSLNAARPKKPRRRPQPHPLPNLPDKPRRRRNPKMRAHVAGVDGAAAVEAVGRALRLKLQRNLSRLSKLPRNQPQSPNPLWRLRLPRFP